METVDAACRRQRAGARHAALGVGAFALIAVPWVLGDAASSGRLVHFAPGVAAAVAWIVLAVRMVRHAQVWAKLPNSAVGLRSGLDGSKRIKPQQVLSGLTVFFGAWLPWKLAADWSMYQAEPWRAAVGIGGFAVIAACLWWYFARAERGIDAQIAAIP